jgi:hypothetical protein
MTERQAVPPSDASEEPMNDGRCIQGSANLVRGLAVAGGPGVTEGLYKSADRRSIDSASRQADNRHGRYTETDTAGEVGSN